MNLFQLNNKQEHINDMLEESFGEITPDIQKELSVLDQNKKAAMCQIATISEEFKAAEGALKEIIKGYQKKLKTCQNAQKSIKSYLLNYLVETDQKKIEYEQLKIRRQASPPSVLVKDTDAVPDEYKKAVVTISCKQLDELKAFGIEPINEDFDIDKKKILQVWKESKKTIEIAGTQINQNEHVRIV